MKFFFAFLLSLTFFPSTAQDDAMPQRLNTVDSILILLKANKPVDLLRHLYSGTNRPDGDEDREMMVAKASSLLKKGSVGDRSSWKVSADPDDPLGRTIFTIPIINKKQKSESASIVIIFPPFVVSEHAASVEVKTEAADKGYIAINNPADIPWDNVHDHSNRFIIAGEAHRVSVIHSFHLSHIRYLVTKGFRNLILEYPHSYVFLGSEYIRTGNDSILFSLTGSVEGRDYWRGLRQLDAELPQDDKLRIWGIDHELAQGWDPLFRKAIHIMADNGKGAPQGIDSLLRNLRVAKNVEETKRIKNRFKEELEKEEVKVFFGDQYNHFKILVNRLDHYKVRRNDEMLEAFKEIYSLFGLDDNDKFLGQFGWGHISRDYKESMSSYLHNDPTSPVRGSTFVVGVHYLNSHYLGAGGVEKPFDGGIAGSEEAVFKAINKMNPSPIKIFSGAKGEKRNGWVKSADVLFLFSGFGAVILEK